jgi:hypothetical protein
MPYYRALVWCSAFTCVLMAHSVAAASLAEKARESGCNSKPVSISSGLYRCITASGIDAFFNVQGTSGAIAPDHAPRSSISAVSPATFPRVEPETQKSRDEKRRKVLDDELASEQKLLGEARDAYDNGAPPPLPGEKADAEKYRQRIARLRQTVQVHERNVDALRKEIATIR